MAVGSTMSTMFTFIIQLLYGIPSVVLNVLAFVVIFRNRRQLRSAYYTLIQVGALLDTLSFLSSFGANGLQTFDIIREFYQSLENHKEELSIVYFIFKAIQLGQNLRCILGNVYRPIAIHYPVRGDLIMAKIRFFALSGMILLSFVLSSFIFELNISLTESGNRLFFEIDRREILLYVEVPINFVFMILTLVPHLVTMKVLKMKKYPINYRRLAIATVYCSVFQGFYLVLRIIFILSMNFGWDSDHAMETYVLPFSQDGYSLSVIWINVLTNHDLREKLTQIFKKKKATTQVTPISNITGTNDNNNNNTPINTAAPSDVRPQLPPLRGVR